MSYGNRSQAHVDTYKQTLDRMGIDVPQEAWHDVDASVPDSFVTQLSTITTEYGNQQFTDEMLAYYDEEANTLELRFVLRIDPLEPLTSALTFADGEFNRAVGLFDRAELCELPPSELVPTDAYLAAEIIPELDM